jgi:hypothetical protein
VRVIDERLNRSATRFPESKETAVQFHIRYTRHDRERDLWHIEVRRRKDRSAIHFLFDH